MDTESQLNASVILSNKRNAEPWRNSLPIGVIRIFILPPNVPNDDVLSEFLSFPLPNLFAKLRIVKTVQPGSVAQNTESDSGPAWNISSGRRCCRCRLDF